MISKRFFPILVAGMLAVALVIPGAVTAAPDSATSSARDSAQGYQVKAV